MKNIQELSLEEIMEDLQNRETIGHPLNFRVKINRGFLFDGSEPEEILKVERFIKPTTTEICFEFFRPEKPDHVVERWIYAQPMKVETAPSLGAVDVQSMVQEGIEKFKSEQQMQELNKQLQEAKEQIRIREEAIEELEEKVKELETGANVTAKAVGSLLGGALDTMLKSNIHKIKKTSFGNALSGFLDMQNFEQNQTKEQTTTDGEKQEAEVSFEKAAPKADDFFGDTTKTLSPEQVEMVKAIVLVLAKYPDAIETSKEMVLKIVQEYIEYVRQHKNATTQTE